MRIRRSGERRPDSQQMDSSGVNKMEVYYLSVFLIQVCVVLLHPGEIVLGLLELALSNLDLLVLAGHLQQGLHLVGTG